MLTVATTPAHAINAHYRAQLERSGCTEMNANDGSCDIHKTKAQNAAQHSTAAGHDPLREATLHRMRLTPRFQMAFLTPPLTAKRPPLSV